MISGKAMREIDPNKPAPFPQETTDYTAYWQTVDKTTYRFDENSKLIVVEGAHAIGKSKFAKELAEELGMLYHPYPRMDDILIDGYGVDFRKYDEFMLPINRTYDEKDFARNPVGPVEGCGDRFHIDIYKEKFRSHLYALKHIFNTGQGVVMEGCPASDYAYFDAAYNQGWIDRESRKAYKEACRMSLHRLMRPNLYIYLDAPVDVAMKNIQDRGNEWDKDSPVWTNKRYMTDIYTELKKNFLRDQQRHSRVLVYDWTVPGDIEIVVEDIEALNFDFLEETDEQQKDWRLHTEEGYSIARYQYCNLQKRILLCQNIANQRILSCVNLWFDPEEVEHRENILNFIKSSRFQYGYNYPMGDKNILFRGFPFQPKNLESNEKTNRWMTNRGLTRPQWWYGDYEGI